MNLDHYEISVLNPHQKGGQHTNAGCLGVKVKHLPSGIEATCKAGKSQTQNKYIALAMVEKALEILEPKERDSLK